MTEELYEGFKYSRCSYLLSLLRPVVIDELKLREQGLRYFIREPWSSFTPLKSGQYLLLGQDKMANMEQIAKFSATDAERYHLYEEWLGQMVFSVLYFY